MVITIFTFHKFFHLQKQLSNTTEDIKNIVQKAKTRKLTIQSKHTLTLHDMNILYSIICKISSHSNKTCKN